MTRGKIIIHRDLCKGCTYCVTSCPKKLIAIDESFNASGFYPAILKEVNGCTGCALCAISCPEIAIEVFKEEE